MVKWDDLKVGMKLIYSDASTRQLTQYLQVNKVEPEYFEAFTIAIDYGKVTCIDNIRSEKQEWRVFGYELRDYGEAEEWWLRWWIKELFKASEEGRPIEHKSKGKQ